MLRSQFPIIFFNLTNSKLGCRYNQIQEETESETDEKGRMVLRLLSHGHFVPCLILFMRIFPIPCPHPISWNNKKTTKGNSFISYH